MEERKYSLQPVHKVKYTRETYMLEFFRFNKAYRHAAEESKDPEKAFHEMRDYYNWYRSSWRSLPAMAIKEKLGRNYYQQTKAPPLCVDLELASICDLACPFCFRQYIATPDKLMNTDLAFQVIDQAAELKVPSMKFNWRGEPLMHPQLPELIGYAKKKGIVETLLNTNATNLTEKKAEELVDAGLDILIYSFDGGTAETYNKNRPGRFKENNFDAVYQNIRRMHEVKQRKGEKFPYTKIQMILTKECFGEQEEFYRLFSDCVDEVSVGAYMERGGNLDLLSNDEKVLVLKNKPVDKSNIQDVQYWKDNDGKLFIEDGRIGCEQVFQRLMVTYDGRVFMCCYDWGNEHPVGFVSDQYFKTGDADYEKVMQNAADKKKGFEMMNLKMPARYVHPAKEVKTLKQIWDSNELGEVRDLHVTGKLNEIDICRGCSFKETYKWKALN